MSRGKGEALARWQVGQISVQNQTPFPPETFKGSNKPCVHQDPRTQQRLRTVFEHLLWRCRSAVVCRRDRGSGRGYGIHDLGGGHHQPWYRAARTYIVLGNRLLEGTTEPRAPGSRRKEQLPHRRLACGCRESPVKAWVSGGPCRVGDTDYSSTCLRSFKGGHHYLHYLQHSLKRKKVKVKSLSHVRLFLTPQTVPYQAPPSMGFSRQLEWVAISFSRGSS